MINVIRSLFSELTNNQLGGITLSGTRKKTESVNTNPTPATPVLEADEENGVLAIANHPQDLLPQETIRSEVNFLIFPFFALSRRDQRLKTEYHATVRREDEKLEVWWKVLAHQEYGYPRPFDGKVHKAIESIISDLKPPIQNPIPIGSLYHIAKLMNVADKGRVYKDIKEAILRVKTATIHSKGTFYSKGRKRWIEDAFNLYDRVVFTGEELPNGEIADTNYLFLGSWYLDNLNQRHVKPLDYTYYRSLRSPIACRLYELLGVKFYGMGNCPYIRYRYSTLCQLLPVTQQQYASNAKQNLNAAHQELNRTGFFDKVEWDSVPGEKRDWYVTYYPGTRARDEIQRTPRQLALPAPDDGVSEQAITNGVETGVTPQPTSDDAVVSALQNFGISKKQAQKLAKDYPQDLILAKLDFVKWLIDTNSHLVSKNPQGFLIQAIQDDYPVPPQYKSQKQEEARDSEEQEARLAAQEQYQRAKEEARQRLLAQHPPQPIANTDLTTASAWSKVLASLKEQVPAPQYTTWLKDTLLLRLEENTAFVVVANRLAAEWLERRLYQSIARTLEQVLGQPVEVEFVVNEDTGS